MKDPNRLSQEGSEFETKLLYSARSDVMPERSWRVILAGLGLVSPLAASGTAAAAGVKILSVKTVMIVASLGAAGALAVWGGSTLSEAPTPTPSVAPPVEVRAPVAPPKVVTKKKAPLVTLESVEEETPTEPAPVAPHRAVPKKVDTLPLELEAIDEARRALARGDHTQASLLLDRYYARFPKPRLGAEASMLRIETLVAQGDRAGASRLGKAFLKRAPNSPYARRIRSLIGESASAP